MCSCRANLYFLVVVVCAKLYIPDICTVDVKVSSPARAVYVRSRSAYQKRRDLKGF